MLFPQRSHDARGYGASPRERAVSFVAALLICAMVFIVIVQMGGVPKFGEPGGDSLIAIDLGTEPDKGEKDSPEPEKAQEQADSPDVPVAVTPVAPPPVPIPGKVQWPEGFIELSRQDYAAADIRKMKRAEGGGQAGAGGGSAGAEGKGDGPGGVRLHNAQWYREPTDAEIAPYMPNNRPPGAWAVIACRTIEKYHVEDCQEMGESPVGSGLARALRQASWQFLVRPPRVNGKAQIGEWVRIRFDFTRTKGEGAG